MQKKIAIITGASRGIGKAVALDLAKQGYTVILIARSDEKLKEVANEIEKNGGLCDIYPLDISNSTKVSQVIDNVIAKHKRIDVLFNNAGILHLGSVDLEPEQIDAVIDINLKGSIYVASKVVPIMKQQKSGYIINLSSHAGVEGLPGAGIYSASKFGLSGYSESLFHELMPDGIRVTAICPSYVNTDMPQGFDTEQKEMMIPQDEIVHAVNYLLESDKRAAIKELVVYSTHLLRGDLD